MSDEQQAEPQSTISNVDPQSIENAVLNELRKGTPLYWSYLCPDCGGPIWIRATADSIGFSTPDVTGSHEPAQE